MSTYTIIHTVTCGTRSQLLRHLGTSVCRMDLQALTGWNLPVQRFQNPEEQCHKRPQHHAIRIYGSFMIIQIIQ